MNSSQNTLERESMLKKRLPEKRKNDTEEEEEDEDDEEDSSSGIEDEKVYIEDEDCDDKRKSYSESEAPTTKIHNTPVKFVRDCINEMNDIIENYRNELSLCDFLTHQSVKEFFEKCEVVVYDKISMIESANY